MNFVRIAAPILLCMLAARPAFSQAACQDVPEITVGNTLQDVIDAGELGGRPYRLVKLIPVEQHQNMMDATIYGQLPRPKNDSDDVVQLTAGEAIHLVVRPLGGEGGEDTTTEKILAVTVLVFGFGWYLNWKQLKKLKLEWKKGDD